MIQSPTPYATEEPVDLAAFPREPQQLIAILQYFQSRNGYISREMTLQIAEYLGIAEAHIYGVASFYTQFRFEKPGDRQVRVCMGTACHVQGGKILSEEISEIIGIQPGEVSADNKYEFHEVACLGCCAQAPVVEIDGRIHGKMSRTKLRKVLKNHE